MYRKFIFVANSSIFSDVIILHVRKVGWWTGQLYDRVHNLERAKDRFEHVNEAFKHHLKIRMTGKTSKTETLDLCQLPRPPFEIRKMINLPASVKIFKNKLKNRETDKFYFHLPHQA